MNHRALLHAEIIRLNPRKRRRFPLIRIVLGCAALAAVLWFVCNIVVVPGP
jgi:hypothetical protein